MVLEIWVDVLEISGWIVVGGGGIYMLEVCKKWMFSKLVK